MKPLIIRQQDQSDCGVACLRSLLRYYGADAGLEYLRQISGTGKTGTTLLGLYQAALQLGFRAEGNTADTDSLLAHNRPCILHLTPEGGLQHFAVFFGRQGKGCLIGDPATGTVEAWNRERLERLWVSRACLLLEPVNLRTAGETKEEKRRWFLHMLKEDTSVLAAATFLGLGLAGLGLVMAVFTQQLIDVILPSRSSGKLITGLITVGLLSLLRLMLQRSRQELLIRQSRDFNNRVADEFFGRLLQLPKPFFDSRRVGDLVARLHDTARIQRVIALVVGSALVEVLVILFSLAAIFYYSTGSGLLVAAFLPVAFLLTGRYISPVRASQQEVMAGFARSESFFINSLSGITAIKQMTREDTFRQGNRHIYGGYQDRAVALGRLQIRLQFITGFAGLAVLLGLLAYVAFQVLNGSLLTGELMAVLGLSSSLIPSALNLAQLSIPIQEARVAFDRMFEAAGLPPEPTGPVLPEDLAEVRFREVSFRYPGGGLLLNKASWCIRRGEVILLKGPNGCGKSTVSLLLQKFLEPESGEIRIDGNHSLSAVNTAAYRKALGVVDQEVVVFNGSLLENLLYALPEPDVLVAEARLKASGLDAFFLRFPQGYATRLGEDGVALSGGQKQLLAYARAVIREPRLLILDEPEAALDKDVLEVILADINRKRGERITLVISHRPELFEGLADAEYLLHDARLIPRNPFREKRPSVVEAD